MPWDQYGQAIGEDSSHPLIITPFGLCIVGEASGGSATTIVDNTKNITTDLVKTKTLILVKNGKTYVRAISANSVDTFTVATIEAAVAAEAVIFPGYDHEITVTNDTAGAAGNVGSVDVVAGEGANVALGAVLSSDVITVTLGTDAEGALDAAKNTGTLITAAIDAIAGFGATLTGSDGDSVATSTGSILFSGGYDAYGARDGDKYWITI